MSTNFYVTNSYSSYPQLKKDVKSVRTNLVEHIDSLDKKVGEVIFKALPPIRRISSIPDKIEADDLLPAAGLASLAVINLPEDCRDIAAAYAQIRGHAPKYDYKKYQHDFSFFKGTLLQDWMKGVESQNGKEIVAKLYAIDQTLYNTSFGEKVKGWLGITDGKPLETTVKNVFDGNMEVTEVNAKNKFAKLTGRAMKRVTLLGVAALGLLELPKIFKAISKGDDITEQTKNTAKQTVKSGVNVAAIISGIGYGGAIGAKHFGAVGSLFGMGAGAVIGATASNSIQDMIG